MTIDLHQLFPAFAMTLVHVLWQAAALALLAAASFALLKHAGARHAAGMACQLAMLALPLLTFIGYLHAPLPEAGLAAQVRPDSVDAAQDWALSGITLLWMAGVVVLLVRQAGGLYLLRRLDRNDHGPLPAPWQEHVADLCRVLGIVRPVAVRLAHDVAAPFTLYVLRPVIWLPSGLLRQLPQAQVQALLAHELAHVRRLDWLWNLLQVLVESVLFFHPAVWWLGRRIRAEREHACDTMAAAACGDPVPLAEALAQLQCGGVPVSPFGIAAHGGLLRPRIEHLLCGGSVARHGRAIAALLLLCALCLALTAVVRPPRALLVNLHAEESNAGPLAAGGFREFRATYVFDQPRRYSARVDGDGVLTESFQENGVARPIDAGARRWIDTMAAMHAPGQAAATPLPPPAPLPPLRPPAPPRPERPPIP